MWLQLELLVFLALFALSFNDVESRSDLAGLESVKPISRSVREAHHGGGKNKKHPPPPKRPPCPNRKKCPKPPNHNKPHPHPNRRPPPRKPIVRKHPPNQQVTVQIQTEKKTDVVNSNNVHYQTIINHYHWVPLEFFNITQPNSTTTPQPTTIIQHFETRPVDQELTTHQTNPASNCSDITNKRPCTGSASQQNTSININLNVAPSSVFYYHNGFPPPVAANNTDNRKNNTQNDAEPSSQPTESKQQTSTEKRTTTTTKTVQTSIKPNMDTEPTENEQQTEKNTTTTTKIVKTSIKPSIEAPSQGEPLTTTNPKPLEESTKTTATKLTTTTVEPLKVPEGQKPDNEDEQLDITSTPDTGRKLPPKPPTQKTSSVANGAHVQNEPDVFGPSVAPT